jgi:peptide/nickel transport system substrate-binding protein
VFAGAPRASAVGVGAHVEGGGMTLLRRGHSYGIIAVIVGLLLSSWGISVGQAAPSAKTLPVINIALFSDINTLDPAVSSSFYDRQVMNNIYDKLFDLNSKGKVVKMLATGYKVSKNGLTYTITLRHGVKFQDGTAFNAQAVKFNLDRYRLPTSAPRAAELLPVSSVSAQGKYTVKIKLSAPFSPLISILTDRSGMMASPKAVQSEGANYALHPVGTGPFKFQDRVKGDHITLVRNGSYWRKGYPKARQVVFKIFTDPNTELVNLQSGQVDFMDTVTSQNIATVQHAKSLRLANKSGLGWGGFWLNTKVAPLNNRLVRQAISLLIDRTQFVKVIDGKTASPADSPFGPGDLAYGSWDKAPARNVKKAKQLLSRAHASNLSFTLGVDTAPIDVRATQVIAGMLSAGSITAKTQTFDFPTLLTDLGKHNFQASFVGWSGRPDPDQNAYNHFITGGPFNYGQYSNATTDKYLKAGRRDTSAKKRRADYIKVAKQLQIDVPYVFLIHAHNAFAMKSSVKGFVYVPDGIIRAVGMTK